MKKAAAIAAASIVTVGMVPVAGADEVSELKAAVAALQKRLDELENRAKAVDDTNDRQTDQIAMARSNVGSWVSNFTWKGDFRYRNESIDQEYVAKDRNRDRIRVRAGFVAKVNDTVRTELMFATTEGGDPRSSNQTLTGENSRKALDLDMAYVEWAPNASWKLTAGKMRYPWVRPGQSVLFDGDINPEGLAVNFTRGDVFASTFYNLLEERSAAAESTMFGGQLGWRPTVGAGRLTVGASYFAFNGVQGRNPFYNASSNGNTTRTTGCITAAPCLVNEYSLVEAFAEYSVPVAGRPLSLYADYFNNADAANGLDTAYSAGVLYGRASDPRTWEIGYYYQLVEKDALYGQYIDSDFGAGSTDARGGVIKFGYALARNWVINGTYMLNETNVDVPVTIAGVGAVTGRDYKRLQLDLNFKY
jgi:hypothetical protein